MSSGYLLSAANNFVLRMSLVQGTLSFTTAASFFAYKASILAKNALILLWYALLACIILREQRRACKLLTLIAVAAAAASLLTIALFELGLLTILAVIIASLSRRVTPRPANLLVLAGAPARKSEKRAGRE